MTQEEKQLLLKDICGRLPYGLKGIHRERVHTVRIIEANSMYPNIKVDGYNAWFPIETFKPYLRSMSSMTEEEKKIQKTYIYHFSGNNLPNYEGDFVFEDEVHEYIDWLNANHFDYRGLIEKGLANEAPEDMYNLN